MILKIIFIKKAVDAYRKRKAGINKKHKKKVTSTITYSIFFGASIEIENLNIDTMKWVIRYSIKQVKAM